MSEASATMTCPSCGSPDMQERCPRCGQEAWRGRLTLRRAARELFDAVTDLDGRLLRTFIDLVLRPGTVARDQIEGRTVRHVSSLRYLLLVAAAVTVLTIVSGAGDLDRYVAPLPTASPSVPDARQAAPLLAEANQAVQRWFQVLLMAIVPMQAVASWLFFERARLYLAEHLVFNAYVVAQQTLFYVPFIPMILSGPHGGLFASLGYLVLSLAYMAWAYVDFFRGSLPGTLARVTVVALLSYAVYFAVMSAALLGWFVLRGAFA